MTQLKSFIRTGIHPYVEGFVLPLQKICEVLYGGSKGSELIGMTKAGYYK